MKNYVQPFPSEYPKFFVSDGVRSFAEESEHFWLVKKIAFEHSNTSLYKNRHLKDLLFWKLYVDLDLDIYLIAETPENKVVFAQEFPEYVLPVGYTELHLKIVRPGENERGGFFCYLPSEQLEKEEKTYEKP